MSQFSETLTRLMRQKHLKSVELCEILSIRKSRFSKIKNGGILPTDFSLVEQLAKAKHREEDMLLYNNIETLAPELIAEKRKIYKGVSPNVDFYSGFVYDMLDIPVELYTPIFAIARIVGWSAHRLEEIVGMNKIIRPAYKSVMQERELPCDTL